jgi:hypothetical protein
MLAPGPNPLLVFQSSSSSSFALAAVFGWYERNSSGLLSPFLLIHAADRLDPQLTKDDEELRAGKLSRTAQSRPGQMITAP